jgi:hypothetical protein
MELSTKVLENGIGTKMKFLSNFYFFLGTALGWP